MKKQVELYIDNGNGLSRVDMFDFEEIKYVTRIQDVKDIAKVLTDYSHTFTVPSSSANNKIFKHYYKYDITGGFDARYKRDALIKLNGVDFRKGQVSLSKANLKNGGAYSYSIVFYGKTVSLKQLFGKDELDVLTASQSGLLNKFSMAYTADLVSKGFSEGYTFNGTQLNRNFGAATVGDYCFPFISAEDYHYYDSADGISPAEGSNYSRNIHPDATYNASINQYVGVNSLAMKPAIKIKHIVDAIEEKYNITFSSDFFSASNPEYNDLFMWMNRETGDMVKQIGISEFQWNLSDFPYVSDVSGSLGDVTVNSGTEFPSTNVGQLGSYQYTLEFTITPDNNTGLYSLSIIDANTGIDLGGGYTNTSGVRGFAATYSSSSNIKPVFTLETSGGVTSCTVTNATVRREVLEYDEYMNTFENDGQANHSYTGGTPVLSLGLDVGRNLPKMTIINFLDTLFKMFNLTAYFEHNTGDIVVKTLDDFYNDGKYYDISTYVDAKESEVSKVLLYNEINFLYDGDKTFAKVNSDNLTNDEFGNERVDHNSTAIDSPLAFDGNKNYDVKLPLEKMMYERMTDQADEDVITDIQWGWMANDNQSAIKGKPLFLYVEKITAADEIRFSYTDGGTSVLKTSYIIPKNTLGVSGQSLNWGSEFDEYTYDVNNKSLFDTYYKQYIGDVYHEQARLVNVSAYLPSSMLLKIRPNDKMVINHKSFKINTYETNLTTGKTKFVLVTENTNNGNKDTTGLVATQL